MAKSCSLQIVLRRLPKRPNFFVPSTPPAHPTYQIFRPPLYTSCLSPMIYEHLNSPPPYLILSCSPRSGVFAGRSSISHLSPRWSPWPAVVEASGGRNIAHRRQRRRPARRNPKVNLSVIGLVLCFSDATIERSVLHV